MLSLFLIFSLSVVVASAQSTRSRHIILIIGDDVGFNDVSFRGSEDIPTPNIDALGYAGRILDRHYSLPTCTPSRSSLLTGQHAVRTGMQGFPLSQGEPRGLPLNFTILPEFLKKLNYSTHIIGKWHIGSHRWNYTPTYRGFDSFLGYYYGMIGYFSHKSPVLDWQGDPESTPKGYDMHRNKEVAYELEGRYATELFTSEAEKVIWEHNSEKPLFLELSHLAVHAGEDMTKNEVSNEAANDRRFGFIKDGHRRRYAGAMAALDDSVGRIISALADRDMLKDSLVVFLADNGARTVGIYNNSGSNYPLRGQKATPFEGGIRTPAVVWHADIKPTSELYTDLFHITDWLPTFYEAAGGNVLDLGDIDGISQWERISGKHSEFAAARNEFIINSVQGEYSSYLENWWKYTIGVGAMDAPIEYSGYYGSAGRSVGARPYNLCGIVNSETSRHLSQASNESDFQRLGERAAQLRRLATLPSTCRENATKEVIDCKNGCLFNLKADPCETENIVDQHPEIVSSLLLKLRSWESKTVPQLNKEVDVNSDPRNYNGTWVPWLDFQPKPEQDNHTISMAANLNFLHLLLRASFVSFLIFLQLAVWPTLE